jgi:hypothetical protein
MTVPRLPPKEQVASRAETAQTAVTYQDGRFIVMFGVSFCNAPKRSLRL